MNLRLAIATSALLLVGCPSGPDAHQPPEIDMSAARRLEAEGKFLEAIVEHARLVADLTESGRVDARAHAAWGRILGALHRLKAADRLAAATPDIRTLCASLKDWCASTAPGVISTGAAGHWSRVLSLGADPPLLGEAAGAIADLLAEKLDAPSLRRGRLEPEGDLSDRLYRRSLAQAAADYARYAVCRARSPEAASRAARLLRKLGREIRDMSALPGVQSGPAARWAEQADKAEAAALALEPGRNGDTVLTNDLRQEIEVEANGLLKAAVESVNKANDLLSRRADEGEILESLETALRHFVAGRECLVEPSQVQKRELVVMSIAADALRSLAFRN